MKIKKRLVRVLVGVCTIYPMVSINIEGCAQETLETLTSTSTALDDSSYFVEDEVSSDYSSVNDEKKSTYKEDKLDKSKTTTEVGKNKNLQDDDVLSNDIPMGFYASGKYEGINPTVKNLNDIYSVENGSTSSELSGKLAAIFSPSDLSSEDSSLPRRDFIDIASYQGWMVQSDFDQLKKNGVKGVCIKLTEGTSYKNPFASNQIAMAKKAGLIISTYHYSHFSSIAGAKEEANFYSTRAKELGLPSNTVMVNDAEDGSMYPARFDATQTSLAFKDQLSANGYKNVVHYCSESWMNNGSKSYLNPDKLGPKNFWVAKYLYGKPSKNNLLLQENAGWQYTSQMYFTFLSKKLPLDTSIDYTGRFTTINNLPDKTPPTIASTKIEGNPKTGKFSVRVITNKIDSLKVKVAIWSNKNGQDDIVWYEGNKIKNGEYLATFDASKHNFESGAYSVHAYAYNDDQKVFTVVNNNLQVSYIENTVAYSTHVQSIGWQSYVENGEMSGTSGKALRLEGIKINLPGISGIEYTTHVQSKGWLPWVSDNKMSGTTGQSLRLEGIKIKLKGDAASKYDLYYRVHIQDKGWLGWAKNGESAGSQGMSKRLEGINIKLVAKGQAFNRGSDAFLEPEPIPAPIPNINYSTHVQSIGWQKYVSNGELSGTSGRALRLEGIKINLNNLPIGGSVQYSTHIQSIGWQENMSDNQLSGTTGQSLRLEGIKIQLAGELSKIYDIYYRVHIQDKGWLGWAKNGEPAGSSGMSKRLEGINIKLYKKGDKVDRGEGAFISNQEQLSTLKTLKTLNTENQQKDDSSIPSSTDIPKPTEPSKISDVTEVSESNMNDDKETKLELKLDALNDTQKSWFENFYPQVVQISNDNDLFASVMLGQIIEESDWGQSELAMNANNLFGVEADSSWTGEVYEKNTSEFIDGKSTTVKAKFRKYPSQVDSLKDYVSKIVGNPERYVNVLRSKAQTFENAAQALQNGEHATDLNYTNNLIDEIKNYNLEALD